MSFVKIYSNDCVKENLELLYSQSSLGKNKSKIKILENATVVPPTYYVKNVSHMEYGVLDKDNNYIVDSGKYNEYCNHIVLPDSIPYEDKEVLYCGNISTHYGHFLLESTTRLTYYLKNREHVKYLCFSAFAKSLPKYAKDFFKLLQIPLDIIILVTDYTKFKKITLPPCSYYHMQCYTEDFVYPFLEASKNVKPAPYKKIYFTRKYWDSMAKCLGEEKIEKLFNKNGFYSVAMEQLSLQEQIAIIKGAEEIAGINGTAFHNILFSDEPKTLIMLNRNEETDCQYIINEATNAKCYLIQAFGNPLPVYHPRGPFIVGVTKYLKLFLKDYKLNDFSTSFNPNKHLKEFLKRYITIYSDKDIYNELISLKKNKIEASDIMKIIDRLQFPSFKYHAYHVLSKMTFGNVRKYFKYKYKELKNLKNDISIFKY